jgi:hypothetical protein
VGVWASKGCLGAAFDIFSKFARLKACLPLVFFLFYELQYLLRRASGVHEGSPQALRSMPASWPGPTGVRLLTLFLPLPITQLLLILLLILLLPFTSLLHTHDFLLSPAFLHEYSGVFYSTIIFLLACCLLGLSPSSVLFIQYGTT